MVEFEAEFESKSMDSSSELAKKKNPLELPPISPSLSVVISPQSWNNHELG